MAGVFSQGDMHHWSRDDRRSWQAKKLSSSSGQCSFMWYEELGGIGCILYFICMLSFRDKWTEDLSSVCVAANWPKQMCLTLILGKPAEHIFSFSTKPRLWTRAFAGSFGSCPVKPEVFLFSFLVTEQLCWSSLDSATERIKSTRIVTHSVSPLTLFFILCEGWNQEPSKHILASLIFRLPPLPTTYLTTMIPVWTFLRIYTL